MTRNFFRLGAALTAMTLALVSCDPTPYNIDDDEDEGGGEEPEVVVTEFQTAAEAVAAMGPGWNVGNTLESNSGDCSNMWIEAFTDRTVKDYETAWGQPVITRALIHMFKEAGFGAIRVPVTWYPHMGKLNITTGPNENGDWKGFWKQSDWVGTDVDPVWMARVKEVVGYVIDEGMYCILNVHHDTGTSDTAWLVASESNYTLQKSRYEALWEQIANEFKDYPETLLFESYNEMTDPYGSWCFASYATKNRYDADVAKSAYKAINSYAQLFVDTVRGTGGANATRNLIVNTYAACSGAGTWNSRLKDPLKNMSLPTDSAKDHLALEIHSYWDAGTYKTSELDDMFSAISSNLQTKAPVIVGEWGVTSDTSTSAGMKQAADFATDFVTKARKAGCATFWWMGLSDGEDRSVPKWSMPMVKDAIIAAYAQ